MKNVDEERLVMASDDPRVDELIAAFRGCSPWRSGSGWNRLEWNDRVRECVWDNQSGDGKKWDREGKRAFPWQGASDCRVRAANSIIDFQVAVLKVSFYRAVLRALGVRAEGEELAANMTRLMEWMMGTKQRRSLAREVELSAQYFLTYGIAVLHPFWDREVSLCLKSMRIEELAQAAQQEGARPSFAKASEGDLPSDGKSEGGGLSYGELLELVLNPETESEAARVVVEEGRGVVEAMAREALGKETLELLAEYEVSESRARRFVRGLREKGVGELPLPYVTRNEPVILALRPWDEVFFSDWASDLQLEPMICRRVYLHEGDVRGRGALEGWDQEWIEKAVEQKGKVSVWGSGSWTEDVNKGIDDGWQLVGAAESGHELIEVLYFYRRCVDEDGVMSRWVTVCHAGVPELAAKHALAGVEHGMAPFVEGVRESRRRDLGSSRGIPELMFTDQQILKTQRDGIIDWTSIGVLPPVWRPAGDAMGTSFRYGPAVENVGIRGNEPKFMEIPGKGVPYAMELMAELNREASADFGRPHPEVPLPLTQTVQEKLVGDFLSMWTCAFGQQTGLMEQFTSDETFARVTGSQVPLPKGRGIVRAEDFILQFDPRELDMEFVMKQYDAIVKGVLPVDSAGVVDRAKLVKAMMRAISPGLARELVNDEEGASQAVFRGVQNDLILMSNGMDPEYGRDDDPAAGMKLQFATQIVQSNPKLQGMMGRDRDFVGRLEKYAQSLQFNVDQDRNKMIGRIGVDPDAGSAPA